MQRLGYICAAFALLPVFYVGSYYALVVREVEGLHRFIPCYRVGSEAAERFFSFWHDYDRSIRPDYWGVDSAANRK